MTKRAISRSLEFDRIAGLPIRDWRKYDFDSLIPALTKRFKTPNGQMVLRPIQAASLKDFYENNGLLGNIGVGHGKSLICYLAPLLVNAERPLLLIKADLKEKTLLELTEIYNEHFILPSKLKVMSYEKLSRTTGQKEFVEYAPDLIIADECHKLKNTKAACTRRVMRWFKEHPDTKLLAVSGTTCRKSIMNYWHTLSTCLRDKSPLPRGWREVKDWSLALDEEIFYGYQRLDPGVLLQFKETTQSKKLDQARESYRHRLTSTPGVIFSNNEEDVTCSIQLDCILNRNDSPAIQQAFKRLRETWQTPNGEDLMDAMQVWAISQQLATGFYLKWKHRPPQEWLDARKEWAGFVRRTIAHNRKGIDSEEAVKKAVLIGEYSRDIYDIWAKVKPTFEIINETVWLDDSVCLQATEWLKKNDGICWVWWRELGPKISELSGLPFYSNGGINKQTGKIIEKASGPIIASIGSNVEGRNLQKWNKNLVVNWPNSNVTAEQLIGRTHRSGQDADEVSFDVLLGSYESWVGFNKCLDEARFIRQIHGTDQKVLLADIKKVDKKIINNLKDNWAWNVK